MHKIPKITFSRFKKWVVSTASRIVFRPVSHSRPQSFSTSYIFGPEWHLPECRLDYLIYKRWNLSIYFEGLTFLTGLLPTIQQDTGPAPEIQQIKKGGGGWSKIVKPRIVNFY